MLNALDRVTRERESGALKYSSTGIVVPSLGISAFLRTNFLFLLRLTLFFLTTT